MSNRTFSPIELNHLCKFGYPIDNLSEYGDKPVEYITGHATFYNYDFLVTPSVLIPRIETEKIIDISLQHLLHFNHKSITIADIGTGSGCVGISLAKELHKNSKLTTKIYFSDISSKAISIAKGNCLRLMPGVRTSSNFVRSDLLGNYPVELKFDLILANLPYIPSYRINALDSSVKDWEPLSALDGGVKGTRHIDKLLSQIPDRISDKGIAILEIDDSHVIESFIIPLSLKGEIITDLFNRNRFLVVRRNS